MITPGLGGLGLIAKLYLSFRYNTKAALAPQGKEGPFFSTNVCTPAAKSHRLSSGRLQLCPFPTSLPRPPSPAWCSQNHRQISECHRADIPILPARNLSPPKSRCAFHGKPPTEQFPPKPTRSAAWKELPRRQSGEILPKKETPLRRSQTDPKVSKKGETYMHSRQEWGTKGIRIIVIEDNADDRELLLRQLKKAGLARHMKFINDSQDCFGPRTL